MKKEIQNSNLTKLHAKQTLSSLSSAIIANSPRRVGSLLAGGVDVNATEQTELPPWDVTPIMYAGDLGRADMIQGLIQRGAKVNARDRSPGGISKNTALHYAAGNGHLDTVVALIEAGANVNAKNSHWETPIFWSVDEGHVDVIKKLLSAGADPTLKDRNQYSLLHRVCHAKKIGVLELLIDLIDVNSVKDTNDTPIIMVVSDAKWIPGPEKWIEMLVKKGADLKICSKDGTTPLAMAVMSDDIATCEQLLAAGADITKPGTYGKTMLELARERGFRKMTAFLKSKGAK